MQFVTAKLTFDENPDNLAPRMPWPRDRNFYTSQIAKPTYTSREPLPVQLTLSSEQADAALTPPQSPKRKLSLKSEAIQRTEQQEFDTHKKQSYGNSFNLSAKVWFLNDQLTLVLDPLNRPREVSTKQQRRRSSILRALGKGGIPADASVDQRRKSSLVSLLDEPGSTDQQGVRRKSSILNAIKRRSSSGKDSHSTDSTAVHEQPQPQQDKEERPTFNLNWHGSDQGQEQEVEPREPVENPEPKPRRWSTQDIDVAQHKPFPLYINDKALTSINVPFSKITSIHTTQLRRDDPKAMTPPGSPKTRKASVAFETPSAEKVQEKPSEGSRNIASKPATIEIEVHDPANTKQNNANGTISIEFWDTLSGQVEADIVLKYIEMVRMNNNKAPQDIKRAAEDLVQSESQNGHAQPA